MSDPITRLAELRALRAAKARHSAGRTASLDMAQDMLYAVVDRQGLQQVLQILHKAGDKQSVDLLRAARTKLIERLSLDQGEDQALGRLANMSNDGPRWGPDLIRNNVFKVANSLGMHLPSGMFASQEHQASVANSNDMRTAADPKPEGEQFADLLKKKITGVKYNAKTDQGSAKVGKFPITFSTSGDSGVLVEFPTMPRLKTTPAMAVEALDAMSKLWDRYNA